MRRLGAQRILLTGDRGVVGRWVGPLLKAAGYEVFGFDIRDGRDVTDAANVALAAANVDVVVHLATLPDVFSGPAAEMQRVNVRGTENVLAAAKATGHTRVVVFSSPHVFGIFTGTTPASFPIRDDHPRTAVAAYGQSKIQVEDLCEQFTDQTGIATFCPRPFWVWLPGQAADLRRRWQKHPEREREAWRTFGAFVDVRDVASAVFLALESQARGHHRFMLCSTDIAATVPAREVAAAAFPGVPLDEDWFADGRSGLVDTTVAQTLLGWRPAHVWGVESRLSLGQRIGGRLRRSRYLGLFPR